MRPDSGRLYRFLSVLPQSTFTVEVCVALLDVPVEVAQAGLDELTAACLLEEDGARFRLHSLLRVHTPWLRRQPHAPTPSSAQRSSGSSTTTCMRRSEWTALLVRSAPGWRQPRRRVSHISRRRRTRIAWFEEEHPSLLALMRVCAERRFPTGVLGAR